MTRPQAAAAGAAAEAAAPPAAEAATDSDERPGKETGDGPLSPPSLLHFFRQPGGGFQHVFFQVLLQLFPDASGGTGDADRRHGVAAAVKYGDGNAGHAVLPFLPVIMEEAFYLMRAGRPGPVLIEFPLNVQNSEFDFDIDSYVPREVPVVKPDLEKIKEAVKMIGGSKAPVIIMGGGCFISECTDEVVELAEALQIPVITTYQAKGGIPENHPLNAGHAGIQVGQPVGNRVFQEVNEAFDDETYFTAGCGITQIWSGQLQTINKAGKYLASGGAGTLGYEVPAAFGVKVAKPDCNSVVMVGDFGLTFMGEEIAVASAFHKPIIVVVVNNAYLGLIRQNQKGYGFEYAVEMPCNQDGTIRFRKGIRIA